jgi:hypothetical protein
LIFVFSASNSDLYIASRTLHGLAVKKQAPTIFAVTDKRGVPFYALGLSALIACIAFLNVAEDSAEVFGYFVNLVSSTYTNGQQGDSNHVATTRSLALTELTLFHTRSCLRHMLTLLPIAFSLGFAHLDQYLGVPHLLH